jgi:hypothetical protein
MWYILAILTFGFAVIAAFLGIHGITPTVILGVIALGLIFLTLGKAEWMPAVPWQRRVGP